MEEAAQKKKKKKKKKNQDSDEDNEVSDSEKDPLTLQKPTLQHILEHLRRKTRWEFMVIMGGPDLLSPEEGNLITSLHVGQNKYGNDFSEACPKFNTKVIDTYVEFLLNVFDKGNPEAPGIKKKSKMVGTEDDNDTSNDNSNHSNEEDGEGEVDDTSSHPTIPYVADSPTIPTSDAAGPVQNFAMPMQNFAMSMQNFATPMQNVARPMQNVEPPMQNSATPPPFVGAGYSPPWDQPSPTPSGKNYQAPLELMPSVLGMQFAFGNGHSNAMYQSPHASQHVQCDNAIGDIGKENHIPIPAERSTKPKKNAPKCSAPSDVEEGPAKKTSKCVILSEAKDGSKTNEPHNIMSMIKIDKS
ncbi:hypothetical protein PAXRUDRAFT_28591 [Paxillus rubicundulus Ve08.2h10]|uniref:Unplaced genomic scaffold scaffold_1736, whole genome shotgun sequence n=1 Tax=Paxillus rubicundulus Ve08.2h10 TaxID=930991 RepID=A0A0D0C5Y2_9AGAM|nr:hypothetical protein PAXRUDRAFT_28591 [Paxillus rubicundulus Ve08.2h10]